jgi:quinol monooxygenase YgiN
MLAASFLKERSVSVTILVKFKADPGKAAAFAAENAELMRGLSQRGRDMGCISHRFISREGEMMAIDEWDSEESFHKFFGDNADIQGITAQIGLAAPPEVTVWQPLDMKDEF